jgi:hypothetical protein
VEHSPRQRNGSDQCIGRRKTEVAGFNAEESGMTAWFCARYENGKGEAGNRGPVVSAIIP